MFTIVTEACICAPEDAWHHIEAEFDTLDEAISFIQSGTWHGDVCRIRYHKCDIAFADDYHALTFVDACPALERFKYSTLACSYDELPF